MNNPEFNVLEYAITETGCLCEELAASKNGFEWFNIVNIDTLLGVLVGGIITLFGSVYVHRLQYEQQAELKRTETIYTPLYNELMKNHKSILVENPYPSKIHFTNPIRGDLAGFPLYSVWEQIKLDTRHIETPEVVINAMDDLYIAIKDYQSLSQKSREAMSLHIDTIFHEETNNKLYIASADAILDSLLNKRNDELKSSLTYEKLSEDKQTTIINRIINEISDLQEFKELEEKRKHWEQLEKQAIECLAARIEKVKKKYSK